MLLPSYNRPQRAEGRKLMQNADTVKLFALSRLLQMAAVEIEMNKGRIKGEEEWQREELAILAHQIDIQGRGLTSLVGQYVHVYRRCEKTEVVEEVHQLVAKSLKGLSQMAVTADALRTAGLDEYAIMLEISSHILRLIEIEILLDA
jgi:hypothetical protein